MSNKNSRTDVLAADQALIDGTTKNQTKLPASFPCAGQQMTPTAIISVIQARITAGKAVIAADAARTDAVKADKDERASTRVTVNAYKRLITAMFINSPATLGDFGLKAPKEPVKTVQDKAQAAAKAQATRKTLGTKGNQQKKAAKAAVAAAPQASAEAANPAAQPAPTAVTAVTATKSGS